MTNQLPPGPKGNALLGNMSDMQADAPGFLLSTAETYGDIFSFRIGPQRIVVVNSAELIQEVLVRQMKAIVKADFNRNVLARFLGQGILTSEGEYHRRQRKLVQPAFHSRRINAYADTMVEQTVDTMAGWHDGDVLQIDDVMMRLTMGIVSKTLFDAHASGIGGAVGEAIADLQALTVKDFNRGFMLPMWLPTAHNRRIREATQTVNTAVSGFIHERRQSGEDKGDLLSMLLLAQDEEDGRVMTDEQVRDEAVTLFAAGHETTANALTWTFYLLSQNPDAQRKLQQELDSVLATRRPELADLTELPYTEAVIKEVLRLYPPAWLLMSRTPSEAVTLDGYQIEPGTWIWVSPYVIHRNANYFADPGCFDPDRFLGSPAESIPRYAYIPFGGGARVCIGNSFAMMEARLILATIAQKYRLRMVPGQEIVPEPEITMSIRGGLKVQLEERT